jgi:type IV pilus assembly protein PilM
MKLSYSRYFPTPSFLSMNSFSIDISDQSIKYGEIKATTFGLRLGRFGQIKIPSGVVVSGRIENEKELVSILKDLKNREKLNFIRVSLPEEQMYLFTLSLPKTEDGDLKETILLQIEEHVPLKAIDTVFDFNIIKEDDKFLVVEVVAIAITTIESYLSVFEKAGLTPLSFELEAQAIARAVIPKGDNHPIMIVDFGNSRTGVSIVHNGRVLFTTTIDMGGVNLTSMISKNFDLPFDKAEEMKRSYGLSGYSNIDDIFPVILNGISVLRDELNKQYAYWKTHNEINTDNEQIDHIILCGGDANLSGLSNYLETSMNVKVENANAWVNISDMDLSVPSMSFEESLGYVTVLGLALGNYNDDPNMFINVLPEVEKKKLNRNYMIRFASVLFSILALSGVVSMLLLFPAYFFSKEKESIAENRLESFNLANPELKTDNLDEMITHINSQLLLLSNKKSTNVGDRIKTNLIDLKPAGINFSQILYNKRTDGVSVLEVHGIASDRTVLRSLKSMLENNSNFSEVDFPVANFIESTNINFKISMVIK